MEKNNKFFKLNKLYHYIFGEKFYKKFDFEWHKYPSRVQIIQETINRKKYKSYLEIGCDQDQVFSKIKNNLKWDCKYKFDEGIKKTILWYVNKFNKNFFNNDDFKKRIGLKI